MTPPPALLDELLAQAGWVRRLARRLAGDAERAEELTQRTLLVALERPPSPRRAGRGLRPWLSRVVTRLHAHERRSDTRRREREQAVARDEASDTAAPQLLEQLEEQQRLARMVADLPEPYRSVLLRRYYRGESVLDIASATGRSPATVRSQLARGLALVRTALERRARIEGLNALGLLALAAGPAQLAAHSTEVVAMKTSTQIATLAGLLFAGVLGAGAWVATRPAGDMPTGAAPAEAQVVLPAPAPSAGEEPSDALGAETGGDARTTVAASVPPAASERPAAGEPAPTRIALRVTDEFDVAIAGATLNAVNRGGAVVDGVPSASTSADGRTELALPDKLLQTWRGELDSVQFAVGAARHATQFVAAVPKPNERLDLGTVRLARGSVVAGRVLDEHGQGVPGARVLSTGVALPGPAAALRLSGPDLDVVRINTLTDALGGFELAGLPAGDTRVWAHASGALWTIGEPRAIVAGHDQRGLEITLAALPDEARVVGLVIDPSGAAVPGARVHYQAGGALRTSEGDCETDARGGFELANTSTAPLLIRATDPQGRFGPSAVHSSGSGGDALTLELSPRRLCTVQVFERDGGPIARASVMARVEEAQYLGESWAHSDADGNVSIALPDEPFTLIVGTELHEYQEIGPLDPRGLPEEYRVELAAKPRLAGVVMADGKPLAGAHVELCKVLRPDFVPLSMGFPQRFMGVGMGPSTTDEQGRFAFGIDPEWTESVLLAWHDDWALTEERVTLEAGRGREDLELTLTSGGALEGAVLVAADALREGIVVAISRGDGHPRSVRTDAKGQYRFARLTPGSWRVEVRDSEPSAYVISVARQGAAAFRWDCDVIEGETTRYDIDRTQGTDVTFDGRFTIDGAPAVGWAARLVLPDHAHSDTPLPSAVSDERGVFQMKMPAGRYELELRSPVHPRGQLEVYRNFEAPGGPLTWSDDLRTGVLRGTAPESRAQVRAFHGNIQESHWERVTCTAAEDGAFEARAPAGECSLQIEQSGSHGFGWYATGDAVITAGGTTQLE